MEYKICARCGYSVPIYALKYPNRCHTCSDPRIKSCKIYYQNNQFNTQAYKNAILISNTLSSKSLHQYIYSQLKDLSNSSNLSSSYIKRELIKTVGAANVNLIKLKIPAKTLT